MVRRYETLLLLSPELTGETRQEVIGNLSSVVENQSGKILEVDEWGMRDLAYPVKNQVRGYYVRLEYGLEGTSLAELERIIRISDGILKFVTVKLSDSVDMEEA